MTFELLIVALLTLVAGLLIGWLFGGRSAGKVREELAAARVHGEQVAHIRAMHQAVESERDAHLKDLTELRARASERESAFEARIGELLAVKESLSAQFAETGAQLLETAQRQFLERADARFRQSEETAGQGLKALLAPVHERLTKYEEAVEKVESERRGAFSELKSQIEFVRAGTERVSGEAAKLVNALRNAPKARGRWGEQQLRNVLENCGLSEHADFQTEVSVTGDDGARLRPDVIIRVPGGQSLVIDAKVSLNAYQDAFGAVDEAERVLHLAAHATSMRNHVNGLGNKSYQSQFGDGLEYVVMFVPGEHFLSAALEQDPTLWDFAFDKRVLLATPTNLIAIARTVSAVWRQEKLAKEARQIGELGKELYDRLAKVGDDLGRAGASLNNAVTHFNKATTSFNTRLTTTGKRFRDLDIDTGQRTLEDVAAVEALATHAAPLALAADTTAVANER